VFLAGGLTVNLSGVHIYDFPTEAEYVIAGYSGNLTRGELKRGSP